MLSCYRGHSVNEGYLVTGLIPLTMPIDVPLWMLAISVIFAVVIGKEVFGGTGMNILNPALTARAFLFFAYPIYMSGDKVWVHKAMVDGHSGSTILGELAASNNWQSLSWNPFDMMMGTIPGSVGETSFIAVMIGALILIATGIGSWRIILSTFLGGFVMASLFNMWGANELMTTPAEIHLIIGSFAFGAVFMATDPVTGSQTNKGKYIYGFNWCICYTHTCFQSCIPRRNDVGYTFNEHIAPLVDHYVIRGNIKKRLKRANA